MFIKIEHTDKTACGCGQWVWLIKLKFCYTGSQYQTLRCKEKILFLFTIDEAGLSPGKKLKNGTTLVVVTVLKPHFNHYKSKINGLFKEHSCVFLPLFS